MARSASSRLVIACIAADNVSSTAVATALTLYGAHVECVSQMKITASINVVLPPRLMSDTLSVVFPSVGVGNRLFVYTVTRLAAALLGRRFSLLSPGYFFAGAAADARYTLSALPLCMSEGAESGGDGHGVQQRLCVADDARDSSGCVALAGMPLSIVLRAMHSIGRDYVSTMPAHYAAGGLVRAFGPVVASWLSPLVARHVAASVSAHPDLAVGERDWVVHVRAGDIYRPAGHRGGGGGGALKLNPAYCPPPVWWYTWLASRFNVNHATVVTGDASSQLTSAVVEALRAGGAAHVTVLSGSETADFGTLLRGRNLALSCSTFAWWAAMLLPFAQSTRASAQVRGHHGSETSSAACETSTAVPAPAIHALQVAVPLTGMLRAGSRHALHADLSLCDEAPQRWWDPRAGPSTSTGTATATSAAGTWRVSAAVRVEQCTVWDNRRALELDSWECSKTQRDWVLEDRVPEWAAAAHTKKA